MNYREFQLRQIIKNDYVPKRAYQSLELEKVLLEGDLEALRTSLEFANLGQLKEENKELTKLNQALTLLAEKRKADLAQEKAALLALAKQKITKQKQAKELLANLEAEWIQEKEELATQLKQSQAELAKKEAILTRKTTLLKDLLNQKQTQLHHAYL